MTSITRIGITSVRTLDVSPSAVGFAVPDLAVFRVLFDSVWDRLRTSRPPTAQSPRRKRLAASVRLLTPSTL